MKKNIYEEHICFDSDCYGYSEKNWTTRKYEGHDHSERSWNRRLNVVFEFLLGT
ncbi:MAG TPA: hypothetical protein VFB86_06065 [Bacteroidales bacterium]|nr:hypothetical protein [Bacteroidales bacterium]